MSTRKQNISMSTQKLCVAQKKKNVKKKGNAYFRQFDPSICHSTFLGTKSVSVTGNCFHSWL